MKIEFILLAISLTTIVALLFSINYTAGIVWRVEKKLDVSYKFFLLGVIFIFLAECLDLYYSADNYLLSAIIVKTLRLLFALCFLRGIVVMRRIVRKLDGEIEDKKKKKLQKNSKFSQKKVKK